jgi:hypothetical protein
MTLSKRQIKRRAKDVRQVWDIYSRFGQWLGRQTTLRHGERPKMGPSMMARRSYTLAPAKRLGPWARASAIRGG